jgi:hypothetical protein
VSVRSVEDFLNQERESNPTRTDERDPSINRVEFESGQQALNESREDGDTFGVSIVIDVFILWSIEEWVQTTWHIMRVACGCREIGMERLAQRSFLGGVQFVVQEGVCHRHNRFCECGKWCRHGGGYQVECEVQRF